MKLAGQGINNNEQARDTLHIGIKLSKKMTITPRIIDAICPCVYGEQNALVE